MKLDTKDLQARAKRKRAKLLRQRRDPRYKRAMGKLVAAKLLQTQGFDVAPFRGEVDISDALWAGAVEPRVLELLPAIILKKPGLFLCDGGVPEDLQAVAHAIRRGEASEPFRGVPASQYLPWVQRIGHRGKSPTLLKSFRLQQDDLALLRSLSAELGTSEVGVLRKALRALEREQRDSDGPRRIRPDAR